LKAADQVLAMFEAPTTFICNECVTLFIEEVAERRESG
jgi:ATP-dependent protease Clp ATPase subunit